MSIISEIIRLLFFVSLIVSIPLIYYRLRSYKAYKKRRILANWEDIKKHISLDELEKKIQNWKEEGYNVDELEQMIEYVTK